MNNFLIEFNLAIKLDRRHHLPNIQIIHCIPPFFLSSKFCIYKLNLLISSWLCLSISYDYIGHGIIWIFHINKLLIKLNNNTIIIWIFYLNIICLYIYSRLVTIFMPSIEHLIIFIFFPLGKLLWHTVFSEWFSRAGILDRLYTWNFK